MSSDKTATIEAPTSDVIKAITEPTKAEGPKTVAPATTEVSASGMISGELHTTIKIGGEIVLNKTETIELGKALELSGFTILPGGVEREIGVNQDWVLGLIPASKNERIILNTHTTTGVVTEKFSAVVVLSTCFSRAEVKSEKYWHCGREQLKDRPSCRIVTTGAIAVKK